MLKFKISILVHGTDEEHDKVWDALRTIQGQLDILDAKEVEVRFYIGNDRDEQGRKRVLLASTYGDFYHEIKNNLTIPDGYILGITSWLNKYETDEKKLSEMKIYKRKPWQINKKLPPLESIQEDPNADIEDIDDQEIEIIDK